MQYARERPLSAGVRRVDPWQPIEPEPTGDRWRLAPGAPPGEPQPPESMDSAPGATGDYELLEELGRGGMGIVYRARQLSLNRVVALKVLRADGFHSEAARRRFRAEAETVAELNHPHIVSIFDTAEIEGHPCFAMEWVRGRTLADLAQPQPLAPHRAARYLEMIARAIEHAHSRGILHRDLKPSNVLVDQDDEPRITDFGLAKHLGSDANLTLSRQLMGSPNFMAPEQAIGQHDAIGPRTDIYGLGATLFFLITGRPPFQADIVTETLRQLAAQDPVAPRLLNPAIPCDLETLCLKCLDKEPHRRYQSALEVAEELARFLRGEPIRARPLSPAARVWRWSRRKPVLASLLTGISILTLVILIGAPLALMRIHRAQGQAELAAAHTARLLYVSDMNIAFQALRENRLGRVRELLERHRPQAGQEDLRSWEWGHLWHESRPHELLTLPGDNHDVSSIAYSPDGAWLAVAKHDGHVEIWDLTTHQVIVRLAHDASVWDLAFTSDRRFLVTVTRTFLEVAHRLRTWEVSTWRERANAPLAEDPYSLAVTPGNTGVVVSSGRDPTGPSTVARFELPALGLASVLEESPAREMNIALAAQAPILAVARPDGINIWQLEPRMVLRQIPFAVPVLRVTPDGPVLPMALSPDGTTLAVGGERLHLFDLAQDSDAQVSTHNFASISSLAFSPDGALLAAAHTDSTITLWHDRRSAPWLLKGHRFPVTALAFSPDGMTLASASVADRVKVWSAVDPPGNWPVQSVPNDGMGVSATAGDWMLWWTRDHHIEARNIAVPGVPPIRRQLPFPVNGRVHLSPGARWLCFADPEGNVGIWETQSLQPILTLPITGLEIPMFCFSPDETKLATFDPTTRARIIWQVPDGLELARQHFDGLPEAWRAWWGSDSRSYLVADAQSRGLWIWDVADNGVRALLPHAASIWRALMSDDHTLIATLDALGRVTLWDARTHRELHSFPERGPAGYNTLYLLDFSADSRRLAVLNPRREVRLYDTATAQEITAIAMPDIVGVGFSPDDQWLVLGTVNQFHYQFHYLPSAPLD